MGETVAARGDFLPFAVPAIGDREIEEVVASLRSGWISTGPKVKSFEILVAESVDAGHAVAVSSCTAGLHLSLVALGIGPGDEVIVPTMTFSASANVVEHVGARPVLVDVGDDYNIDIAAAARAITSRTRAIMPVHFASQAVDLDEIFELADAHDLAVIEDAAHAIGSSYHDLPIGSDRLQERYPNLRRTTVFSFYATKNITTGEGGMVVTADAELADQIRILTLHGMSRDAWKRYTDAGSWYYEVVTPGYKANMTDLQAAIGIHQLARLDDFRRERRRQAELYDRAFDDLPEVVTPVRRPDRDHIFHLYVLGLELDRLTIDRAGFIDAMRDYNIGTSVHFIPVHIHPFYAKTYDVRPDDIPNAHRLYRRSISLPIYPGLKDDDLSYVQAVVTHLLKEHRR